MRLVASDPIAAYRGVVSGGALIYASYAFTGFVLKKTPFGAEPGRVRAVIHPDELPEGWRLAE